MQAPVPEVLMSDPRWIEAHVAQEQGYANELLSRAVENQARTIAMLIRETHFTYKSILDAVTSGDLSKLEFDQPTGSVTKVQWTT